MNNILTQANVNNTELVSENSMCKHDEPKQCKPENNTNPTETGHMVQEKQVENLDTDRNNLTDMTTDATEYDGADDANKVDSLLIIEQTDNTTCNSQNSIRSADNSNPVISSPAKPTSKRMTDTS